MKAVIYARYSSDNQREESIEGQIRECKAYAEKQSITVLSTYIDRAFSAKTDNRPEFQRMIKDSGKRLFDVIIVWKLDRFARNRYDSAHYKAILRKNGVKVVSATEIIAADSTGILLESLLEGYAEFYSAELSEKVIRGMTENALKCKYNGGGLPVGYTIDSDQQFQIDPVTAPIVRDTFEKYHSGSTIVEIVRWLNERGIKPQRGKAMGIDSVKRLLKNRRYIGEYKYRDTTVPNGIPALVDIDLFNRVGERLAKNKKAPARYKAKAEMYLLSTKLHCGLCGAFMVGESGTSKTGKFHQYYKCVNAKKHKGCKKKSVKKAWIEALVMDELVAMLFDDAIIDRIVDLVMESQNQENTALPVLQTRLTETTKAIENILNAIQQGILTPSTKERLEALEQAKEELEMDILQEELFRPFVSEAKIRFWLHKFREGDLQDPEHRQRLVDSFINVIYLFDDHFTITFNYKEGAKTVSLADVQASAATTAIRSDLCAVGAPITKAFGP
ncbi:MAG: recombinase family protein [Clostridiales bacterium]|jgi:DNA invertase Pin-like site-specific DNA recombinase|nr:recombinase family protein [Clostridiales bacterium]